MKTPSIKIETNFTSIWLEKIFRALERLLIHIYNRLNTNASKRVLKVYKHVSTFNIINNQIVVEFNGDAINGEVADINKLAAILKTLKLSHSLK